MSGKETNNSWPLGHVDPLTRVRSALRNGQGDDRLASLDSHDSQSVPIPLSPCGIAGRLGFKILEVDEKMVLCLITHQMQVKSAQSHFLLPPLLLKSYIWFDALGNGSLPTDQHAV